MLENLKAERQLLKLNQRLGEAQLNRDVLSLERLIADDYLGFDPQGMQCSKSDFVGRFASGRLLITRFQFEEVRVRVFGAAAVMTGRIRTAGTFSGVPFDGWYRYTDVWAERNGKWSLVASQVTPNARGLFQG